MIYLTDKKCVACEGGVPPLTHDEITAFMPQVVGWRVAGNEKSISREFVFKDFKEALAFVNEVGKIAEEEGHHPDITLYQFNKVKISLWTHAIGGLSENDFILAAKVAMISKP